MINNKALQRLHKRLSDEKKQPTIITKLVTFVPAVWKTGADNAPVKSEETASEQFKTASPVVWKHKPIPTIARVAPKNVKTDGIKFNTRTILLKFMKR